MERTLPLVNEVGSLQSEIFFESMKHLNFEVDNFFGFEGVYQSKSKLIWTGLISENELIEGERAEDEHAGEVELLVQEREESLDLSHQTS